MRRFSVLSDVMKLADEGDEDARNYLKVEIGEVGNRTVAPLTIERKDLEKENLEKKIKIVTYWVEAASRLNMDNIRSMYRREQALLLEL